MIVGWIDGVVARALLHINALSDHARTQLECLELCTKSVLLLSHSALKIEYLINQQ